MQKQFGLDRKWELLADINEIIQELMSLALLPHHQIEDVFEFIKELALKLIKVDGTVVYGGLLAKIDKLLSYF